ncbi:nuclear pore complex protein Nup205-like [Amphibalanus amphitrite]|uniref:nuclear pore complex protein Nup205-like n=1 Tax=Amphibalanus amphitrite TaxID=1232801 RepID=UPI001C908B94|nr:nuclear pore complex protein Nup205-like [Amphibalanus amphitrite]
MAAASEGVWSPFVELLRLVNAVLVHKDVGQLPELETALRRHKTNFINLLKNPAPSAKDRAELQQATKEGISVGGEPPQLLPQLAVDEAIIISDLFQLNERAALHLLQTGEAQRPHYPGLTRGLVAILLYYDGRRALVTALKTLVQARKGISWTTDLPENISIMITKYTDEILEENMLNKLLELLPTLDWERDLQRLNAARALGSARYLRQLSELHEQTRQALADTALCWAAQVPLSLPLTKRLMEHVRKMKVTGSAGELGNVELTLLMALLYSVSAARVLRRPDADELLGTLPLLADPEFASWLHRELAEGDAAGWQTPELRAVLQFAWAMTLSSLRPLQIDALADFTEQDEKTTELSIRNKVFLHIREKIIANKMFHSEEFFVRHVHDLMSEMLVAMPLKVKELRNRADEAARTIQMNQKEGLQPPADLPQDFEHLLRLLTALYEKDPLALGLSQDYWASEGATQRQVYLHKFVRVAGDLLPPPLYVPYADLLAALASSPATAPHCYSLLSATGSGSPLSITQIFSSLHQYYSRLMHETPSVSRADAYSGMPVAASKGITAQELKSMLAGLRLIRVIAENDASSRLVMCETPSWPPLVVMLRLQTCAAPGALKAQLLRTLAALARAPEVAQALWQGLEQAQILQTTQVMPGQQARGIKMELEEVEARAEQFPQTRAFLGLLSVLVEAGVPASLGAGLRAPGIHPYVAFVIHDVLLNFDSRAYKDPTEKYVVAGDCLEILLKLVDAYDPTASELGLTITGELTSGQTAPGASVVLQLMQRSKLLKQVLFVLDEACRRLGEYRDSPGRSGLERSSLLALRLLEAVLRQQPAVLTALRQPQLPQQPEAPLLPGLELQLLAANPRTGASDLMVMFARYLGFSAWLPEQAASAAGVLSQVCRRATAQEQLVALFSGDPDTQAEVTYAFVECLDADAPEEPECAAHVARCHVLDLLTACLRLPAGPTVAHLLLGLAGGVGLQAPGVLGTARTCLHAVLAQLTAGLTATVPPSIGERCPAVADKAYEVIYLLCAAPSTSEQTLRYLRSTYDFIYGQLRPLPTAASAELPRLRHLTWLLRLLALELKVLAAGQQRSPLARLTGLLLSSTPAAGPQMDLTGLDISLTLSQTLTGAAARQASSTQRRKMLALLDQVSFSHEPVQPPDWEYFNPAQVEQVIKSCEEPGPARQVDIKRLNAVLNAELAALQGTAALSQRHYIVQEIKSVLEYCVRRNEQSRWLQASADCVESWRQVLEVLLTAVPANLLSDQPDQVIMDVSRHILNKTLDTESVPQLTSPLAGTLLLLMTSLRSVSSSAGGSGGQSHQPAGRLVTLRGIVDSLLRPDPGRRARQRTRVNLYGALLHLLSAAGAAGPGLTEACREYGRALVETVCRDACGGHDVCRMLAMCSLDALLRMDSLWLEHLSGHGYLDALAESLQADDAPLRGLLVPQPQDLRPLYLYESKMSLLCRVALVPDGARTLLQTRLMVRLSDLTALDCWPHRSAPAGVVERYRLVARPALRLCLCVLAALGRENQSAVAQVNHFLLSHLDMVTSVLRHQPAELSADSLEELVLLTGVLSQTSHEDLSADVADSQLPERRGQLSRLQQLTLAQLPRFVLSRERRRQLQQLPERQLAASPRHQATVAMLQVLSHLLLYSQGLAAPAGSARRSVRPLFSASLQTDKPPESADAAPSLGCLLHLLRCHSELLTDGCHQLELLQRQLDAAGQLDGQLLAELAGDDQLPLGERRQRAHQRLDELRTLVQRQVELSRHVLELALHLLWTHLDLYLVRSAPANQASPAGWPYDDSMVGGDGDTAGALLSPQLLTQLKRDLPLSVTDALLSQVQDALKHPLVGRGHYSFSEAMVRRIQRVTRLHCTTG